MTTFCPNLPGYIPTQNLERRSWARVSYEKSEKVKDFRNNQTFDYPLPRRELFGSFSPIPFKKNANMSTTQSALESAFTKANSARQSFEPSFMKLDRQVLRFSGFFKEGVSESPIENYRIRKLDLYYYLVDSSISIFEPKQTNSGMMQGTLLKRQKVTKGDEKGRYFSPFDFKIGAEIEMFGRRILLCDCDLYTREFYEGIQYPQPAAIQVPSDAFESKAKNKYVPQKDTALSEYMEKSLGGGKVKSEVQFLQNDRKVLRYFAESAHHSYIIHYYLADFTVEIIQPTVPNSGKDSVPQFLRRQKISKGFSLGQPGQSQESGYVTPKDIRFGEDFVVFGKKYYIKGCDTYTQNYYKESYGVEFPLGNTDLPEIKMPEPQISKAFTKSWAGVAVPPYNGFGGEEDSLLNVYSLSPKRLNKDFNKFMSEEYDLKFSAQLMSNQPEDNERRFVITYFLQDDAIAIAESSGKNSGFVQGKFLEKGKYKNIRNNSQSFSPFDFKVGKSVTINGLTFYISDSSEATKKWYAHQTI